MEATPSALAAGEVHVWRIAIDRDRAEVDRLAELLSADERERARRLRVGRVRGRFVVARGMLRSLLGRYLGAAPSTIGFRYGPRGKPALDDRDGSPRLQFNLAHSEGLALLALSPDRRVGIDVEAIRPMDDLGRIVERFFSPRERAAFGELTEARRTAAFFRGWTRKEAYLKATGEGLATPLDQFVVSIAPDEPAALLEVAGRPDEAGRWCLHDVDAGPGFAAALVVEGPACRIHAFRAPAADGGSLESQGLDRIESRGLPRRVIAEDEPHGHRDGDRGDDGQR